MLLTSLSSARSLAAGRTAPAILSFAAMRRAVQGTTPQGAYSPGIVAEGPLVFVSGQGPLRAGVPQPSQAGQALNAAGLVFGSVSYAVDYTCTNIGLVTWQNPAAGHASTAAPLYPSGSRRLRGRRANARDAAGKRPPPCRYR